MATYYLLSTINSRVNGWRAYHKGSKKECEEAIDTLREMRGTDIYADTLRKNAVVVSKTTARLKYKYNEDDDFCYE